MKKIPYGIISGICAMLVFYLTAGLIAAYIIQNGVAQQVGDSASFFETWWQILLFIVDIIAVAGLVYGIIMFIKTRKERNASEIDKKNRVIRMIFNPSVWTMLTICFTLMFAIVTVGSSIAMGFRSAIDGFLGIDSYIKENIDDENINTEYYKSDYYLEDGSYDHKRMRANSKEVALQTAVEGTVLLWNDDNALPLQKDSNISLFGISTINYAYLGTGSGSMSVTPEGNMRKAFMDAGMKVNSRLNLEYTNLVSEYSRSNRTAPNEAPWSTISSTVNDTISTYGDAAIMVISRVSGEHNDIRPSTADEFVDKNNYLDLSTDEAKVLTELNNLKKQGKLKKIILVINSANAMQFKNIRSDVYGIDACIYAGLGGTMSYYQIAQSLSGTGEYVMSGHLADILVNDNYSAPVNVNMGDFEWTEMDTTKVPDLAKEDVGTYTTHNEDYIVYQEGIYVGYRYYETRYEDTVLKQGNASGSTGAKLDTSWIYEKEVAFPFGHGESYTDFEYSNFSVKETSSTYDISVTVKNVGTTYAGKDAVQVYIQKPYTEYDKNNNIEKSSVELVGFDKTKKLAPNEEQEILIKVNKEDLKTYDAYGKGTYILEKGDYYLAIGSDSHDALNNILAKKGYTTSDGMDYNGDSNFVHHIEIENDDYEIYSVSSVTGNKITNQFNDADLNIYEGSKDQKIKYLTRSDWSGSFPTEAPKLKLTNDIMLEDIQYGHPITPNPEDKMPLYESITTDDGQPLSLIMLKDLDYDHEYWDDLLNQMSVDEQEYLISYGLHYIAGAESVGAPGCKSKDGPAGIKVNNSVAGGQMSFPSEVVLAQTFDEDLIQKLGDSFGLEILHVGYNVIYAPGGCIHRSQYSGRNWEYFSEDGFLSGKMLSAEVKGLQNRGAIVMTKHFALNDQETNRYGVATWANEQSIREIYLKGFEAAVVEGRMNGVMSSFNRIGLTWAGAHKGLLTNVLRDEWDFLGIVETDSCTSSDGNGVAHMTSLYAKSDGLMAGNDLWMDGKGNTSYLEGHLDNPTVMLALREACHRILYTQLHSNAMNGIGANTRIIQIDSWWMAALDTAKLVSGVTTAVFLIMAIASFIIASGVISKFAKKRKMDDGETVILNGEESNDKKPNKKLLILCIIAASLIIVGSMTAIIVPNVLNKGSSSSVGGSSSIPTTSTPTTSIIKECEHKCEICGLCIDMYSEEDFCKTKCTSNKNATSFEAEDASLKKGTKKDLNTGSKNGIKYVGNLNENAGASITFYIDSDKDTTASLVVSVCKRSIPTVFTDLLITMVNDVDVISNAIVPQTETGTETWFDFVNVNLGCVSLKKGENIISFTVAGNGNVSGYNFDKIALYSLDATFINTTACDDVCEICGYCLNDTCNICKEICEVSDGKEYKLEAEDAIFGNGTYKGASTSPRIEELETASNGKIVGRLSENVGATVTFKFNSDGETYANLKASVIRRASDVLFINGLKITVNGKEISPKTIVKATGTGKDDWYKYFEVNLGCISLVNGENTITFTVASTNSQTCFNMDYVKVTSKTNIS